MIRSTFLHLPGVGPITEAALWQQGVTDWSTFRQSPEIEGLGANRRHLLETELDRSEQALQQLDGGYFARRLPSRELWRLYPAYRPSTAFLDIETTGLSPYEGIVTVVTVHGGGTTRTFVADDDLEELPAYLRRFSVLVTFNGLLFDIPFLESRFPGLIVPPAHIDLRYTLYRLGYRGGLKRIEEILRVGDRSGVEGIYGRDAVRLWEEYRGGSSTSLEQLIRYNRADTLNLEPLIDFASGELCRRLLPAPPDED